MGRKAPAPTPIARERIAILPTLTEVDFEGACGCAAPGAPCPDCNIPDEGEAPAPTGRLHRSDVEGRAY
jgi:hypothetical protein